MDFWLAAVVGLDFESWIKSVGIWKMRKYLDSYLPHLILRLRLCSKTAATTKFGTETEKKIAEALSNKNWGASSTTLNEIAQITYD